MCIAPVEEMEVVGAVVVVIVWWWWWKMYLSQLPHASGTATLDRPASIRACNSAAFASRSLLSSFSIRLFRFPFLPPASRDRERQRIHRTTCIHTS